MISNLRHIHFQTIQTVYVQFLFPHLLQEKSYVIEILKCFLPNLHSVQSVRDQPANVPCLTYLPIPEELGRGDPYSEEAYIFLRTHLLPYIRSYTIQPFTKLYISRGRAEKRKLLNEDVFIEYIQKHGFHTVYLEDLGGIEQMAYFYNASTIISPHGAGLANIVFCKEGTEVIEISSKAMTSLEHFSHISKVLKLKYRRFQNVITYSDSIDSNMIITCLSDCICPKQT